MSQAEVATYLPVLLGDMRHDVKMCHVTSLRDPNRLSATTGGVGCGPPPRFLVSLFSIGTTDDTPPIGRILGRTMSAVNLQDDRPEDVDVDMGEGVEGNGVTGVTGVVDLHLSSDSSTIDPQTASSRILVSRSLAAADAMEQDGEEQPHFSKLSALKASGNRVEYRRVRCPPHRYTPLREHWEQILTPLVEYLKLQVRLFSASLHV